MSPSLEPIVGGRFRADDRSIDDDSRSQAVVRNRRAGLILFAIYLGLYAGFMAWNVIDPNGMARPVLLGVNLAIVYGFGLIVAALLLALIYVVICNRPQSGGRS